MKFKIIIILSLIIIFNMIYQPTKLFGCPLDVTITILYPDYDDNTKIQAEMNWHPFEVNHLLAMHNKKGETWEDYKKYEPLFYDYIEKHFKFYNNNKLAKIIPIGMPRVNTASMYAEGVTFLFDIVSNEPMDKIKIRNTLFIKDFVLQTNKVVFILDDISPNFNDIEEITLTTRVTEVERWIKSEMPKNIRNKVYQDLSDYETIQNVDNWNINYDIADNTSLMNSMEDWYNYYLSLNTSDINNKPTNDNTDNKNMNNNIYEKNIQETSQQNEIIYLDNFDIDTDDEDDSKIVIVYEDIKEESDTNREISTTKDTSKINQDELDEIYNRMIERRSNTGSSNTTATQRNRLSNILNKVLNYVENKLDNPSLLDKLLIFLPVLLLGFLHAFESGHGKTILVTYLINKNKNLFDIFLFLIVTVSAHIITVGIIGFISIRAVELVGNAYNIIPIISRIGAGFLLLISIFIIYEGLRELQGYNRNTNNKGEKYGFLFTGFMIGIAPCPIGLGIVSIVIITGKYSWLVPLLLSFGLGIFITLLLISVAVLITKRQGFRRFNKIVKYSPLISGLLMFILSIIILTTNIIF